MVNNELNRIGDNPDIKEKHGDNPIDEKLTEVLTRDKDKLKEEFKIDSFMGTEEWNKLLLIFEQLNNTNNLDEDIIQTALGTRFFDLLSESLCGFTKHPGYFDTRSIKVKKEDFYNLIKIGLSSKLVDDNNYRMSVRSNIFDNLKYYKNAGNQHRGNEYIDGMIKAICENYLESKTDGYGNLKHYSFYQELLRGIIIDEEKYDFSPNNTENILKCISIGQDYQKEQFFNIIINNIEKFYNSGHAALALCDNLSGFTEKYQQKVGNKLIEVGLGRIVAEKMNNFDRDLRYELIKGIINYGGGEAILENINNYTEVNRQKIVDMLYDNGYGNEVDQYEIKGAKKRRRKAKDED